MSEELTQRVLNVIATVKRIPRETVTIDSDFEELGIDSMDAVEILFALENEFDITIPDDEVRSVRNVRADGGGCGEAGGRQDRGRHGRPVGDAARSDHRRWAPSARWAGRPGSSPNRCGPAAAGSRPSNPPMCGGSAVPERRRGARLLAPPYFEDRRADFMDRFAQFAVIAAREAVADARIEWTPELRESVGHHYGLLRGRADHRGRGLRRASTRRAQPRAPADHSEDHGERRGQPHLHGVRDHRAGVHDFDGVLFGGARHRAGVLDGARSGRRTWRITGRQRSAVQLRAS